MFSDLIRSDVVSGGAITGVVLCALIAELATAGIPAVFLARTTKCSGENTRLAILQLARAYGFPAADVNASTLPDGCHPSNFGHAQIAAALLKAVDSAHKPKTPRVPAPLKSAKFLSAAQARTEGPAEQTPLTFFKESGAALKAQPGPVQWRMKFQGTLAAVLFRLGHTPAAMEYQIDGGPWRKAAIQPAWFLNYYFETNLNVGPHELGLRLQAGPAGVILDGLELDAH